MKRRDFVKSAAFTAVGASILPLGANGFEAKTHIESEDITLIPKIKDDYAVHFMAIGDWGRNGEYNQVEVAKQMGEWGTARPLDFVISNGDNFYPKGVVSEFDPLWHYSFENIYTAHALQCDWYPVLGNHDWHDDVDAQIRYGKISRRWDMPARYYTKTFKLTKGKDKEFASDKDDKPKSNAKLLIVFMDTDPFLHENKADYVQQQMTWLTDTLKNASQEIGWRIVVGHHPFYTVGPRITNYDTLTMRKALSDLFNQYKVDIYLSGHEHSLQHLKPEGYTHQFVSGAGSELTGVTAGVPYARFQASENGFMYFSADDKRLNVKAVNMAGKVLYETELTK